MRSPPPSGGAPGPVGRRAAEHEHLGAERVGDLHEVRRPFAAQREDRLLRLERVRRTRARAGGPSRSGAPPPRSHAPRRARSSCAPARAPRSSSGRNAPLPRLMSSTSPLSPSASFLLMMLAAMSGMLSTVAVASRSAYICWSAGAISCVCPSSAQPRRSICARASASVSVGAESRDRLELVERAARVAEAAPRHHRHRDAERRDERREHQRHLVAHAAGGMLVDAFRGELREIERRAAREHRLGERGRLAGVEPAHVGGHQERGHLVVGHIARGVRGDERAPLGIAQTLSVALPFDEPGNDH